MFIPRDRSSQQLITERLFEASCNDPDVFHARLQEIEDNFGQEELIEQLRLLDLHTSDAVDQLLSEEYGGLADPMDALSSMPSPKVACTMKPECCDKILHHGKVWEIRGEGCRKHLCERVCIAESGTGLLVGEMTVRESRLVTRQELEENPRLHLIEDLSIVRYKKIYVWILEDVQAYREPVPYQRPPKSRIWVHLEPTPQESARCANKACRYGLGGKQGERAKPYVRRKDGVGFAHCILCSAEAFTAALGDKKGQPVRRLLGRLARKDEQLHREALQEIERTHGPHVADRFAPRGDAAKASADRLWEEALEYRQPTLHPDAATRGPFEVQKNKDAQRVKRKFPAVYGDEAREDAAWMSSRAAAFRKWCMDDSWRMCSSCGRMAPQAFEAKHARNATKAPPQFPRCGYCKSAGAQGYWAPSPQDVPRKLRELSPQIVEALRPFDVHTGGTFRPPNGYLLHGDMMQFSFKKSSVEANLAKLPRKQRKRGEKALQYLLRPNSPSWYARFWQLHHRFLGGRSRAIQRGETWHGASVKRMPARFIETVGLECALWPHLYWSLDMTETYVRSQDARRLKRRRGAAQADGFEEEEEDGGQMLGGGSRQSAKASFLAKVHSAVIGYSSDSQLLHFVYDLWLFTTIGGAKNSSGTGVREALASKPYSPELWRTYHTALVDLQRQLDWPSLFITIAPYEWSFPYHRWLEDELLKSLSSRLQMPVSETLHLAHVLTQAVKGLLTGANEGMHPKREHVFAAEEGSGRVRYWVARLEFQDGKRKRGQYRDAQFYHGRGTVHVHILLWLRNMQDMDLASKIRADLPNETIDAEMLDLVLGSQLDWASSGWPLREEATEVTTPEQQLKLHHPRKAKEKCCRAYLPDVLAALRCHTDVLASDGRAMVLKYCTSPPACVKQ